MTVSIFSKLNFCCDFKLSATLSVDAFSSSLSKPVFIIKHVLTAENLNLEGILYLILSLLK